MKMTMRRWTSILLSISLVLMMAVYAFADENDGSGDGSGDGTTTSSSSTSTSSSSSESSSSSSESSSSSSSESSSSSSSESSSSSSSESSSSSSSESSSSSSSESSSSSSSSSSSTSSTTAPCTEHKWGSGKITANPTCAVEGVKTYTCSVCEATKTETVKMLAHSYTNSCDGTCNVCGANREVTHTAASGWYKRSSGHYHKCKICGIEMDTGNHYPGPAATEEKDQICLTCGYIMTPKKGHVHSYKNTLSWDSEGHWYPCEKCDDQKDPAPHNFTGGCQAACTECGYENPLAHVFDSNIDSNAYEHWSTCTVCGGTGPKEPHMMDYTGLNCMVCGMSAENVESMPETQEGTGDHVHEAVGGWMKDDANHWQECSCGTFFGRGPHNWDQGEQKDGVVTYVCKDCGHFRAEAAQADSGAPVILIVLAVVAVVCASAAAVLLVYILRKPKGKFNR